MSKPSWSGHVSRKIVRRIVVEGDLILQTPAHFGNGDGDDLVDMPLLTDPRDGKTPLLTGASIAGALRGYLHEHEHGFRTKADRKARAADSASILLFGGSRGNKYGEQSPLIVEDARGENAAIELRDGVGIAGGSRTAEHDKLFSIEMWEAGTRFLLRFELVVREQDEVQELKRALATALAGFNKYGITVGARKRRGYGQVAVTGWRVKEYELTESRQLLDWIANGDKKLNSASQVDIFQALGSEFDITDRREIFQLYATFLLDGSLLIRSGAGSNLHKLQAGDVHLHSARLVTGGKRQRRPVLSGTSLAGALRARAFKIARCIAPREREDTARVLIDSMFGSDMNVVREPAASRISVYEHVVGGDEEKEKDEEKKRMLIQNRVRIDRFTGGASDGALFDEQPLFGGPHSLVKLDLQLVNPQRYEIGLLLLLLKDLWTGDLPLGGESAIGRGRLRGKSCEITYRKGQEQGRWKLQGKESRGLSVTEGDYRDLEQYVSGLHSYLVGGEAWSGS